MASLAALGLGLAILAGVSWVMARDTPDEAPEASSIAAPEQDSPTLQDEGLALFVAKGCVACHQQEDAASQGYPTLTGAGPDLTNLAERYPPGEASLDYLRRWLKDPPAVRPGTFMPNLGLTDEEIESLLRFLLTAEHFAQR